MDYLLMIWSAPEGCWFCTDLSADRAKIARKAAQLIALTDLTVRIVETAERQEDGGVAVADGMEPPDDVDFIRPDACE